MLWRSVSSPRSRKFAVFEMNRKMKLFSLTALALLLVSCGGNASRKTAQTAPQEPVAADMHSAENALDYWGTYRGTLPAADCPGIETTLTLDQEGRYTLHLSYLERDTEFDEAGSFRVEENLLTLIPDGGGQPGYYKVEENRLRHLDGERQPITGQLADHYLLEKVK